MPIPQQFQFSVEPIADPQAIVQADNVRFTVLTSRIIRMEYSPVGEFEDRPSQVFWHRRQPVVDFEVVERPDLLELVTAELHLRYVPGRRGFETDSLAIHLKESGRTWRYGDEDSRNLRGTARTLDQASGSVGLEDGLMSRSGWAVVDDSAALVFEADGWLRPREAAPGTRDLIFFGYGDDYLACLRDYCHLAGAVPLLPRWALGNWWSRYWAYSQEELMDLMSDFKAHDVPLSVCVVDMDWHLTEAGEGVDCWTGYTWNRELFPDPPGFLNWLHQQGLKTALNLHPALGVRPHEEQYEEMARRLGVDPGREKTIPFDIADPEFAQAYFEVLHHPMERQGVDFWWIDWQQGEVCGLPGLDPLWWLNHLHFHDLGRDGRKRRFIFSRWGGLGNHRYPIGFSGDTHVTWDTLAFQPYFTATAANVGYSWWSHDIGGHMSGVEEPELYARWLQFGVFSPILRLHSTNNPLHERRPWAYDAEVARIACEAMRLRHALIPYIYTMAWRNEVEGTPLIRPMYYDYPEREEAYHCPQQYAFGSDVVVAPFVTPIDPDTRQSRQVVWLPPGEWTNLFTGDRFAGNTWQAVYGGLSDVPVFARAGALIPMAAKAGWGSAANPSELDLWVFAGSNNVFHLYEDDGETTAYRQGASSLTEFSQRWRGDRLEISIGPARGSHSHLPARRTISLKIYGVDRPDAVLVKLDGQENPALHDYDEDRQLITLDPMPLPLDRGLQVTVRAETALSSGRDPMLERLRRYLAAFKMESISKAALANRLAELQRDPGLLTDYELSLTDAQRRCLLEVSQQAGVSLVDFIGSDAFLVLWNNRSDLRFTWRLAQERPGTWDPKERFKARRGVIPRFEVIRPEGRWQFEANYAGFANVRYASSRFDRT